MTFRLRKSIYISGLTFSILIFGALNAFAYFLFFKSHDTSSLLSLISHPWWFQYRGVVQKIEDIYRYTALLYLFHVSIILAPIYLYRQYKKTDSAEIFFLIMFFFFISFESFRPLNAYIYTLELPFNLGVAITRTIFFGQTAALLSLFFSSLYAVKLKYQKYGIVLSVILLSAFILAASIPVDPTVFLNNFSYKLGIEHSLWFFTYILYLVILSNLIFAFLQSRNKRYLYTAASAAMILGGLLIFSFATEIFYLLTSIILILVGSYSFTRQIEKIYIPF